MSAAGTPAAQATTLIKFFTIIREFPIMAFSPRPEELKKAVLKDLDHHASEISEARASVEAIHSSIQPAYYVCVYVCMCVCMDGWMDGWMDG